MIQIKSENTRGYGRKTPSLRTQIVKLGGILTKVIKHRRTPINPTIKGINVLDFKYVCQFNPSRKPKKPKHFKLKKKIKNPNQYEHKRLSTYARAIRGY